MKKISLESARKINAIFWFIIVVILMVVIHDAWSKNGPYTWVSFIASFSIYGGFCFLIGWFLDKKIRDYYKRNNLK